MPWWSRRCRRTCPAIDVALQPWTDLPIWLPPGPQHDFLHGGDVGKALAAGLRSRPVRDTVADTWSWLCGRPDLPASRADRPPVGLDPSAEQAILAAG